MADNLNSAEFTIDPKSMAFETHVNGDQIVLGKLVLTAMNAAAIAYMINTPGSMEIKIEKVV